MSVSELSLSGILMKCAWEDHFVKGSFGLFFIVKASCWRR